MTNRDRQTTMRNKGRKKTALRRSRGKVSHRGSLQTRKPKLALQWHPTRNSPLTPRDVTVFSNRKVWWICGKGHEWQAVISNRSLGTGCPYCAGHKVHRQNCLSAVNPALASEWHPSRNAPLTPADVTSRTHRKVWWLCGKGHEWLADINNRTQRNGCPYCSGHKTCKDNCLRTVNPELAAEWHPARNAPLTSADVTARSGRTIWWICPKGHEWQAKVADRSAGMRCPHCSGRKPRRRKKRLEIAEPRIAREWHPEWNGRRKPKDVSPLSLRVVWWKCRNGHEVREPVAARYKRKGCPVCRLKSNKRIERRVEK